MAQNTKGRLLLIDLSFNDTIAASGGQKKVYLKPRKKYIIYQIKQIFVQIDDPIGSSSGWHRIGITYAPMQDNWNKCLMWCQASTGNDLESYANTWNGSNTEYPSSADQVNAINHMECSFDMPFIFWYHNNTDANQTGRSEIKVIVKEIVMEESEVNAIQNNIEET